MCGSTDNPDPLLFIEVYRLRSLYNLVKPVRGSNVEGIDLFKSLLDVKEDATETIQNQKEWAEILEIAVENTNEFSVEPNNLDDAHDYNIQSVNDVALTYVGGSIAKKIRKWTSCDSCKSTVVKQNGGS